MNCNYCGENEISTDYGACQVCHEAFEEMGPSGPTMTINGREIPKTSKEYDFYLNQIVSGQAQQVK